MLTRIRSSTVPLVALISLSLLLVSGVLLPELLPSLDQYPLPPLQAETLPLLLLAGAALLIALFRGAKPPSARQITDAILIGLGMFAIPAALVTCAGPSVQGATRAALFSLVPLFAIVFEPYIGNSPGPSDSVQQNRGALLAGLIAVGGTISALPVQIPSSLVATGAFCLVILAAASIAWANCHAVATAKRLDNRHSGALTAAIAGGTGAIGLAIESAATERSVWPWNGLWPALLWAALIQLPALLLLFWLMRRMSAVRMATRYVLVLFLSVFLGALLLHATLSPRAWIGLLMMGGSTAYLLLAPEREAEPVHLSLN